MNGRLRKECECKRGAERKIVLIEPLSLKMSLHYPCGTKPLPTDTYTSPNKNVIQHANLSFVPIVRITRLALRHSWLGLGRLAGNNSFQPSLIISSHLISSSSSVRASILRECHYVTALDTWLIFSPLFFLSDISLSFLTILSSAFSIQKKLHLTASKPHLETSISRQSHIKLPQQCLTLKLKLNRPRIRSWLTRMFNV